MKVFEVFFDNREHYEDKWTESKFFETREEADAYFEVLKAKMNNDEEKRYSPFSEDTYASVRTLELGTQKRETLVEYKTDVVKNMREEEDAYYEALDELY